MFFVSWTKADGTRAQHVCATAKEAIAKIADAGWTDTPGLRIKDAGGVPLTLGSVEIHREFIAAAAR